MYKNLELDILMKFVAEYSFIYDVPNIDIFAKDVLETIPHEWQKAILDLTLDELRQVPFGYFKTYWPDSLLRFIEEANKFAEYRYQYQPDNSSAIVDVQIPEFIKHKTPSKKLHEIINMAVVVHELSKKHNCGIMLDIGSGLGYLDQIIHYNFGLTTIGFESELHKTLNAKQRVHSGTCLNNMHHVNHKIENTSESRNIIEHSIKEICTNKLLCTCGVTQLNSDGNSGNVIMVGLHSCGDLMQSMMKLFCQIPEIKVFLCAGCCYHKLNLSDFPMSDSGGKALSAVKLVNSKWKVSITGLRLGCQTTREFWTRQSDEDFEYREKCLAYRAVMQSFLQKEKLVWRKPKRHLIKRSVGSFQEFASSSLDAISLNGLTKAEGIDKLSQLFEEKKHLFQNIRVLSLLQTLLQPIWESMIIEDRIAYFQQNGIQSNVLVLCEETVTPRNLILCGVK